jgi:uncharacterized protein (DUF433 family)
MSETCPLCQGSTFKWLHTRLKNGNSVREAFPCPCQGGLWRIPGTDYLVATPGRCGGCPTIGDTRFTVKAALDYLRAGEGLEYLAEWSHLPVEALREVERLAGQYPAEFWETPWLPEGARDE